MGNLDYKLKLKIRIVNSILFTIYSVFKELIQWHRRFYNQHSPTYIKRKQFIKYSLPNSIWIETGTYLGQTAVFLSKHFSKVYTIEPDIDLFKNVKKYLIKYKNITIINSESKKALIELLSKKIKQNINFFLDAHNVGNNSTKTYKSRIANPILDELKIIQKNIKNLKNFIIFVDDVNWLSDDFIKTHKSSETRLNKIINWCKKNNLTFIINHNLMIIKKLK
jgi:hypothetical protein